MNRKRKLIICVAVIAWVVTVTASSYMFTTLVYGKYYSKGNSKGVTTASGMYFSSDCLKNLDDTGSDVTKVDATTTDFNLFSEYASSANGAETTEYVFNIHMKNYENQMLYNDSNLDITYDMYFRITDDTVNDKVNYEVTYEEQSGNSTVERTVNIEEGISRNTTVINNMKLVGGSAKSNTVRLKITRDDNSVSVSSFSKIAVWAIPSAPDYIANSHKLGAILRINELSSSFSCTTKFDLESKLSNAWSDTDKDFVNSMSGLVYDITITGNPPEDKQWLKVTWDNNYIDINRYDEYYLEAQENSKTGTDLVNHTSYMIIKLEAYSYIQMAFYKVGGFDTNNLASLDSFRNLVSCTYVAE